MGRRFRPLALRRELSPFSEMKARDSLTQWTHRATFAWSWRKTAT